MHNQKNRKVYVSLNVLLFYGIGLTIAIVRFTIWPDQPKSQSLNYTIKTRSTVIYMQTFASCRLKGTAGVYSYRKYTNVEEALHVPYENIPIK